MRKQNSDFKTSFITEAGVHLKNHDYHGFFELDDFACWVIADGIDNSETKNSAELVVKAVLSAFTEKPGISKKRLKEYVNTANRVLHKESTHERLKASVMIVVTDYMKIRYAHAGNVKLQVLSKNEFSIVSADQSYYQHKIDDGTYPLDRSNGFEERNNLVNYAGTTHGFKAVVSKKYKVKEMDVALITTVGFWENVVSIEVLDGLEETSDQDEAMNNLENLLVSKQIPELGNYTIATIFINKLFLKDRKIWKTIKKVLLILIPILIIVGVLLFIWFRNNQIQRGLINRVIQYETDGDDYLYHGSFARALEQYNSAITLLLEIRNFDGEDDLRLKRRINQLIIDGEASVDRENLSRARDYFVRVRNYLIDYEYRIPLFEISFVNRRIEYLDTRIHIEELITLGDLQVELRQYARALESYRSARTIAIILGNLTLMQRLNINVNTAQALYDDANTALARANAAEAAQLANNAEGLTAEELASLFENVARIYQNAGLNEEAAAMRMRANEVINEAQAADVLKQRQLALELEANGDIALLAGNYATALAYYLAAERIFRAIEAEFNITLITNKILAVNDLITVTEIITPSPTPNMISVDYDEQSEENYYYY